MKNLHCLDDLLGVSLALLFFFMIGIDNPNAQPFIGYDYIRAVPQNPLPANRSPYEDLLDNSVYNSAPMAPDVKPNPAGTPGQDNPFAHPDTQSVSDPSDAQPIFGTQ